ncbi:MAG: hypothetical protein GY940_05450 [bacterium]|nr:hypothetical protein [bacterium]
MRKKNSTDKGRHSINGIDQERKDRIAQWAFDTRPILGRFHLWLEDVDVEWLRGEPAQEFTSDITYFLEGSMERLFAMTGAVTALGTQLFGRFGKGAGLDKEGINRVKKDADAISAYAMSEGLWYLSRQLPEKHAILVSLGEGLMPKCGETPEMGSNPLLGFGRVYARPQVAKWLDRRVIRLLNDENYNWNEFYHEIKEEGITVWGTAIDTLENTSRFAKGSDTGPMTILHVFNQPLNISKPYEGYIGNLVLPRAVAETAADQSILINFRTPRKLIVEAIEKTYPGIHRENIHVWTLRGKSRSMRLQGLWQEWEELGAHLVDDDWPLPCGINVFTDSGTYATTYAIKDWTDEQGDTHLFICDGYAASAEALQAASLANMLDIKAYLAVFTSSFKHPYNKEQYIMEIPPDAEDFRERLEAVTGKPMNHEDCQNYKSMIREATDAGVPVNRPSIEADDFFPEKVWDVLAVSGYMRPDPYSCAPGVEEVSEGIYKVTVRLAGHKGDKQITFTLRLMHHVEESRLVFNPLLIRFMDGEDYLNRPVRISDSGRIRNELQTLCSEALEFIGEDRIKVWFDRIQPEMITPGKQVILKDILEWYKSHHPLWFSWLEIA